ncbi:hypothetical protein H6S82_21995 [Planktothrix sp. FACHB-1355]|uniref:Uncharacterized protein n=1 Tax=Aerosakkonema funiforme FACHB-1375 TaxID=2949571 RepID=A0A926ZH13_9CYAN|nr:MULTISPECIES: hypothetical protein [Oscillatoriales]MBD2180411.1 hypothetical protein [Aerosakkonema funiforme FACHB-1375]MBD3561493.1 hypothetical protein [Planktothrix sp. FACHB-1355]
MSSDMGIIDLRQHSREIYITDLRTLSNSSYSKLPSRLTRLQASTATLPLVMSVKLSFVL